MNFNSIKSKIAGLLAVLMLVGVQSCKIEEIPDPNGPSVFDVENNATLSDMVLLAKGIESSSRSDLTMYYEDLGIVGRDFYRLTNTDPRYTKDIPGGSGTPLDNNTFYTTRPYSGRYACIRNCYILTHAVQNNTGGVTQAQKDGFIGFAKTFQAYQLMLVANMQACSGIRIDTEDPDNLGPFIGEADINNAYAAIEAILKEGFELLDAGEFAFDLSSGFGTREDFMLFNRALGARLAIYQGKKADALTYLGAAEPFFNADGDYEKSFDHIFTETGLQNSLFRDFAKDDPSNGDNNCVQNDWLTDAEAGDARAAEGNKYHTRPSPLVIDNLVGNADVALWPSRSAPIKIVKNEELALIYAEANIGTNNAEAVRVLNLIRNNAGLADAVYPTTPPSEAELINQLLHERRYSLFGEGHRWVDMRRYGRLNELPLDRPGDIIHECFPRPANES